MYKIEIISIFIILSVLFSCKSDREKKIEEINQESYAIFLDAISDIHKIDMIINLDSLKKSYKKISSDSAELGLEYANKLKLFATNKLIEQDSIYKIMKIQGDSISKLTKTEIEKNNLKIAKEWENSKAGKLHKKHPDWSEEDCERLTEKKIWIGMTLEMLKYLRGNPNSANPSNYGKGVQWQWCWHDYSPSCFYGGEDGVITSYN